MAPLDLKKSAKTLSYKFYKKFLKKTSRKCRRQAVAKERDEKEQEEIEKREGSPFCQQLKANEEKEKLILEEHYERERRRLHFLWLQREEVAMKEFKQKQEQEAKIREQKEEQTRKIQEEFEKMQKEKEDKELEAKNKEDALNEVIAKLPTANNEPWHNPIAPLQHNKDQECCHFFSKTGACRFGDRCSRLHERPETSRTLLIRGFFSHLGIQDTLKDEFDTDIGLEFEEGEMHQHFLEFYADVLPEFKKLGQVVQFKVCCNHEHHLRGNVYVQYKSEEEAQTAFGVFNGRWYGGRQVSCEFSCVESWKKAICGLYLGNRCPKGRSCNFLHVFCNPRGEFRNADHDFEDFGSVRSTTSQRSRLREDSTPSKKWSETSQRHRHSRSTRRMKRHQSPSSKRSRKSSRERSHRHKRKTAKRRRTNSSSSDSSRERIAKNHPVKSTRKNSSELSSEEWTERNDSIKES